ncbi:hypothetical protein warpig_1 [Escherichia phage warpig]|uniref:Uncharacterized protein n=1 Tax=Escherichia phage warpig TaxID=2696461 RepID=A0A6B9X689_9CAUD|nr:hypothetical protein warpig_1 [Escherichia phage warpig]
MKILLNDPPHMPMLFLNKEWPLLDRAPILVSATRVLIMNRTTATRIGKLDNLSFHYS